MYGYKYIDHKNEGSTIKRFDESKRKLCKLQTYTANMKVVLAPTKAAHLDMYDIVHGH